MGLYHSPRVITDGLVLCIDAGNTKSYPGTGSVLSSLIGSTSTSSMSGVYSASDPKSFTFNGSQYGTLPDITGITDFSTTDNYSIFVWVYINSSSSSGSILEKWTGSGAYPYVLRYTSGSNPHFYATAYTGSISNSNASEPVETDTWNYIGGVFDFSAQNLLAYKNGEIGHQVSLTVSGNISNSSPVGIMARGNGQFPVAGKVACIQIYNKALTLAEVKQNFAATRGRFGV